jgi:hypothetical protein
MSLYSTAVVHFAHAKALFDEEFTFKKQKRLSRKSSKKHVRKSANEQSKHARADSKLIKKRSCEALARFRAAHHEHKLNPDKTWIRVHGFCGLTEFVDEDENGEKFRRDYRALITDVGANENTGELTFHVLNSVVLLFRFFLDNFFYYLGRV